MITTIFRILVIVLGLGLFSCSSSKFKYQEAYKFSTYNYKKTPPQPAGQAIDGDFEPIASTNPNLAPVLATRPLVTIPKVVPMTTTSEKAPSKQAATTLTKKEKKALRKDFRQQLKQALKDRKALKKEAKNKKTAMNRKVYSGLIIAGAGIIVAILVSGTLGGLAIIVGVALIAWGLIEEGSV